MFRKTIIFLVGFAGLAAVLAFFAAISGSSALAAASQSTSAVGLACPAGPVSDNFGYTAEVTTFNWVPVTGTPVTFENKDDSYQIGVNGIDMGFGDVGGFPFYENKYNTAWISSNGFLTLGTDKPGETLFKNLRMPSDQAPNAIIAPFWDDLVVTQTSSVNYAIGVDFFAVQWNLLTRFKETPQVTFQVKLFEDGDILFQYSDMNGIVDDATVGIEDGDGIDGLSYVYNQNCPDDGMAVIFRRPPPGARGKLSPLYSGGFIIAGQANFQVIVKNTGDRGGAVTTDSYSFDAAIVNTNNPGWTIQVYDGSQVVSNSGLLLEGASKTFNVRILPPSTFSPGDHALIDFKATSQANASSVAVVRLQVAVPANFMHAYSSIAPPPFTHTRLGLYWKENTLTSQFDRFSFGVALASGGERYLLAWDLSRVIYYNVIGKLGIPDSSAKILAAPPDSSVTYSFPSLANNTQDNRVAVAWQSRQSQVHNLWLSVLDLTQPVPVPTTPENITDNSTPYTFVNGGLKYEEVSAVFVPNNSLLMTWKQSNYIAVGQTASNVYVGLYNLGANTMSAPQAITTNSTDDNIDYVSPTMVQLPDTGGAFPNDGTILIFFTESNSSQKTSQVYWAAVSKFGDIVKGKTPLGSLQGQDIDGVRLPDGRVALAWVSADRSAMQYTRLTPSSGPDLFVDSTWNLVLENQNLVADPSMFADQSGRSVMTWKNLSGTQMYYSLVNLADVGGPSTPPLMFASSPETMLMSTNGQSSTGYIGTYRVSLPMMLRNAYP